MLIAGTIHRSPSQVVVSLNNQSLALTRGPDEAQNEGSFSWGRSGQTDVNDTSIEPPQFARRSLLESTRRILLICHDAGVHVVRHEGGIRLTRCLLTHVNA